jgi:site-specific DNA recombinase
METPTGVSPAPRVFPPPRSGIEAVVIGEPQRAFYGNQFGLTFPVFTHYDVELWVPEVGGAIDPGSEAHDLVMSLYGGMSKGERSRIKTRVRSAMAAQASIEGRYLGGRPPYGYMLDDAGPHPNSGKAAIGQRLRRLVPDPVAAPIVHRIFDDFLAGAGLHRIATGLTGEGIASPSAHDPRRNCTERTATVPGPSLQCGPSPRKPSIHRPSGLEPPTPRRNPGRR